MEVLIKQAHLLDEDRTWEEFEQIQKVFPAFHPEDKVQLIGGVYCRRKKRGKGRIGNEWKIVEESLLLVRGFCYDGSERTGHVAAREGMGDGINGGKECEWRDRQSLG